MIRGSARLDRIGSEEFCGHDHPVPMRTPPAKIKVTPPGDAEGVCETRFNKDDPRVSAPTMATHPFAPGPILGHGQLFGSRLSVQPVHQAVARRVIWFLIPQA
jgi:hypothetical protein